jgi:hypothetical protein
MRILGSTMVLEQKCQENLVQKREANEKVYRDVKEIIYLYLKLSSNYLPFTKEMLFMKRKPT